MAKRAYKFNSLSQKHFINELILFAMHSITEKGEVCTFERITKECFILFPQSFALSQYPKWPDTRKLDWALRALRKKKFISGDPKTFFSLTPRGKREARDIVKTLRQKKLL